jgi:hypothetical protein
VGVGVGAAYSHQLSITRSDAEPTAHPLACSVKAVSAVVSSHVMDNWQLVFYMGGPGLSVHFIIPSMPMPMSIPIPSFGVGRG